MRWPVLAWWRACDDCQVVNLVLDEIHEVVGACGDAGWIVCCTLAHGLREPVVDHGYLGTDAVLRDLERLPGFEDGRVDATFTRGGAHITGVRASHADEGPMQI